MRAAILYNTGSQHVYYRPSGYHIWLKWTLRPNPEHRGAKSIRFPGRKPTLRPNLGLGRKVKFYQFFATFLNQSFEQMNQYDLEDLHRRSYTPTTQGKMWGKD